MSGDGATAGDAATPGDDLVVMTVDEIRCIGVGQCELLEPDVFRIDDDSGLASADQAVRIDRQRAERVIAKCPSAAISIIEAAPDKARMIS